MTQEMGVFLVGGGRGFKVGDSIITAADCLPHLPPCGYPIGYGERTYENLLGPLGAEPTVWAELLFADPVADLAILGAPDGQDLYDEAKAYEQLLSATRSFSIGDIGAADITAESRPGWPNAKLISLDGECISCVAFHCGGPLLLKEPVTKGGILGSPIIVNDGIAIGVVLSGTETASSATQSWSMHCRLMRSLPRWFDITGLG